MSSILSTQRVRDAVTKTAKLLSRNKVEIRQQGAKPHVAYAKDGSVQYVNLPAIPDNPPEEFLFALQGFLDHEVAHVLYTNFVDCQKGPLRARDEGLNYEAAKGIANGIEDIRIEREMAREFRGSAANFSKSLNFVLEKSVTPSLNKAMSKPEGHERTLAIIYSSMMPWMRASAGDTDAANFMEKHDLWPTFQMIEVAFPSFADRLKAMKSSKDAGDLAYEFMVAMSPPKKEEEPPPPEEAGGGEGEASGGTPPPEDDTPEDDTASSEDEAEPPPFGDEDDTPDETPEGSEEEEPSEEEGDEEDDGDDESDDDDGDEDSDSKESGKKSMSLTQAMKKLDPAQRRALFLYNNKRKTVRAVSETMGISQVEVANTMRTGRRALKKLMGRG